MSTRVFLIRHADVEPIGRWLAGRTRGIHLSEKGKMQAQELVRRLATTRLDAIYSSPLERARETAEYAARSKNLAILTCDRLTDIDFGEWTGKTFDALDAMPEWHRFNAERSNSRIPGGETMLDVTRRMVEAIESIRDRHDGAAVAVFSHCDSIRAAIAHYAGMALDSILRISIDPASISALDVNERGAQVLALNVGGESVDSVDGARSERFRFAGGI